MPSDELLARAAAAGMTYGNGWWHLPDGDVIAECDWPWPVIQEEEM